MKNLFGLLFIAVILISCGNEGNSSKQNIENENVFKTNVVKMFDSIISLEKNVDDKNKVLMSLMSGSYSNGDNKDKWDDLKILSDKHNLGISDPLYPGHKPGDPINVDKLYETGKLDKNVVDSILNEIENEKVTPETLDKLRSKDQIKLEPKTTPPPKPVSEKKVEKIIEDTVEIVTEEIIPVVKPQVQAEIHKTWDDLVRKHISSSGKVNYAGFKKDKVKIEKYIKELQSYHSKINSWNKNKRLAYWINVYNAVTVKLIVDNYPVKSITELKGGKPWDAKLINLGGTSYTLNVIENKIIRPKFNEPRIHFAVNCAAKSCPKIMNKAWTEGNIQRYLTKQTKAFLANTSQNKITADKLELSKIFDWYKKDFGGDNAKLIKFINKYSNTKVNENATITFNEYNWKLNN